MLYKKKYGIAYHEMIINGGRCACGRLVACIVAIIDALTSGHRSYVRPIRARWKRSCRFFGRSTCKHAKIHPSTGNQSGRVLNFEKHQPQHTRSALDALARFFFLKRFWIAVATRTARPFRLRCPLSPYLDFRLLNVEAPCLPSRFEISTHGGSYTLILHRRFEYCEPLRRGPNQMAGIQLIDSILQFHATALFLYTARQQPLKLKPHRRMHSSRTKICIHFLGVVFYVKPQSLGQGQFASPLLTPQVWGRFPELYTRQGRFWIAVATRTARPFRLRSPLSPNLDFKLLNVEAPCLPSRFEISTHGGSYTLIHHRRFEYYEPLRRGPNQMAG
ncbi:hypothetical protein T11_8500, partial [Trichinella zimbabwensis]